MQREHAGNVTSNTARKVLTLVLLVEVVGGVVLLSSVLQAFFAASAEPVTQRLSILLAALAAFMWIAFTLYGVLVKRASWARGSALTIHVLMFAAGTGVLQGILGTPLLGWGLVACAFIGFFSAMLARPAAQPPLEG